jgi:hypothetical protein
MSRFFFLFIICGVLAVSPPLRAQDPAGAADVAEQARGQEFEKQKAIAQQKAEQAADAAKLKLELRAQQVLQAQATRAANLERARANTKTSYDRRLKLTILEIDRVCDLSDEQLKRLQVAAQGAIEAALGNNQRVNGALGIQLAVRAPGQAGVNALRQAVTPVLGTVGEKVLFQPLWVTTLKNTLSEDQQSRLTKADAKRAAEVRSARIDQLTVKLSQILLLAPDQEDAMRTLIDGTMTQSSALRYMADRSGENLLRTLSRIPKDKASKFLSKEQLAFWPVQSAYQTTTGNNVLQRRVLIAPQLPQQR